MSQTTHYPWERLWHDGSEEAARYQPFSRKYIPKDAPVAILQDWLEREHRFLILLGQGGAGKTTILQEYRKDPSSSCLLLSLSRFESGSDVREGLITAFRDHEKLSEESPEIVIIDDFDETLDEVKRAAQGIIRAVEILAESTPFKLVLSSRPGAPFNFIKQELLSELGPARTLYLRPLSREDAECAARISGLAPKEFWAQVSTASVSALTESPLTLILLLEEFKLCGKLPNSVMDLYVRGTKRLLRESRPSREGDGLGRLERYEAVKTIAFVSLFAGVGFLSVAGHSKDSTLDMESLGTLSPESPNTQTLKDCLKFALFIPQSRDRYSFFHRTFQEFLAAEFIRERRELWPKCGTLMRNRSGSLAPQFLGIVSLLQRELPDLFLEACEHDSAGLLTFATHLERDAKEAIVDSLLTRVGDDQISPWIFNRWELARLCYDGIGAKLISSGLSSQKHPHQRLFALRVGESCPSEALSQTAFKISLRSGEHEAVRRQAVRATIAGPNGLQVGPARAILFSRLSDEMDEIKGVVLSALSYPSLEPDELQKLLSSPRPNQLSSYHRFLGDQYRRLAVPEYEAYYVSWTVELLQSEAERYWKQKIRRQFVTGVWELRSIESSVKTLLSLVDCMWDETTRFFFDGLEHTIDLADPTGARFRLLLLGLADRYDVWFEGALQFLLGRLRPEQLEGLENLAWLLEQKESLSRFTPACRRRLILLFLNPCDCDHRSLIIESASCLQDLELDCDDLLRRRTEEQSVVSDSPSTLPDLEWESDFTEVLEAECSPVEKFEKILRALGATEFGSRFWPESPGYSAYRKAAAAYCEQLLSVSESFLLDRFELDWSNNNIPWPSMFAARALMIQEEIAPGQIWQRHSGALEQWLRVIVVFFLIDEDGPMKDILERAHKANPRETIEVLLEQVANGSEIALGFLSNHWSAEAESQVLPKVLEFDNPSVSTLKLGHLCCLGKDSSVWAQFLHVASDFEDRRNQFALSLCLLDGRAWEVLLALPDRSLVEFRSFLELWNNQLEDCEDLLFGKAPRMSLADFYLILDRLVRTEESSENLFGIFTRFRRKCYDALRSQASDQSVEALLYLTKSLPNRAQIKYDLHEMNRKVWNSDWQPLTLHELAQLVQNPQRMLVRNDLELMELVLDILRDYQNSLQGVFEQVLVLWNTGKEVSPKKEEEFSKNVAFFLDMRLRTSGVVINREVEVKRLQRLDIKVQCYNPSTEEMMTVTLELKCCSNSGLFTSQESQLKQRYLLGGESRCGIYLIAWFRCPEWKKTRTAELNGVRRSYSLEKASSFFQEQSENLSDGRVQLRALVLDCGFPRK